VYSGRALDFDGTNDYVSVPDDNSLEFGTSDFSFSFWMNLDDVSGTQTIFNRRLNSSNSNWVQVKNTGTLDFGASWSGSSVIRSQINSAIVSANQWYHIAWSVDCIIRISSTRIIHQTRNSITYWSICIESKVRPTNARRFWQLYIRW
jgi:hypothetical protein